MISKELLSEILGEVVDKNIVNKRFIIFKEPKTMTSTSHYINIYELAHKCKEWAINKGYVVSSEIHYSGNCVSNVYMNIEDNQEFFGKLEPEVIFKACQWILDEKIK